jgi:predicted MFS family arabinose efflux permease
MPNTTNVSNNQGKIGRLIVPTLTISRISPQARSLLTTLLLIEIGQTYGLSIGVTNQIKTFNSFAAIFAALLMGFLSVRFRQRTLLIAGLALSVFTTLGCYLAPSFPILIIFYSLGGIAANTIFPMTTALLGEHIPLSERTRALGWLTAGPAAIYVLGYPIVNYIGDWRRAFLIFALPIILVALLLSFVGLPSTELTTRREDILAGYKGVLASRSALACLVSSGMGLGVWQIALSLGSSFYRQQFSMSRNNVVYVTVVMALLYISGTLIARKIIPKYGRRNTAIASSVLLGLFTIFFTASFNLTMALATGLVTCFAAGVRVNASQGLNLEQIPDLRGPMMSLSSAFGSTGNVMSLSLSGYLLINYGWSVMGSVIGVFGFIAGIILYLYAEDPTRVN